MKTLFFAIALTGAALAQTQVNAQDQQKLQAQQAAAIAAQQQLKADAVRPHTATMPEQQAAAWKAIALRYQQLADYWQQRAKDANEAFANAWAAKADAAVTAAIAQIQKACAAQSLAFDQAAMGCAAPQTK